MSGSRESSAVVSWKRTDCSLPEPVVRRVPYVELKLEHPGVDATRAADAFFPDAIPYRHGTDHRVFYWRPALPSAGPESSEWSGVCATTHGLWAVTGDAPVGPELWSTDDVGHRVVVDGTVGGGSTTTTLQSYDEPDVAIRSVSTNAVRINVDSEIVSVPRESHRTIAFPTQQCHLADDDNETVAVTPELHVRYPGERTVYHPARNGSYVLFPSFGIDLDALDRRITVPTTHGELDHDVLAERLDVDLSERPYPERVLWQAFAYSAFDPHREDDLRIGETHDGLLQVENPARAE